MKKTTLLFGIVVCLVLGSHFPLSAATQEDLQGQPKEKDESDSVKKKTAINE